MKRKDLCAIALLIILVTLFYLPLLRDLATTVPALDWYAVYAYNSFFRLSVLQYHQFPLLAPHFGGGYPLIGHPYDISLNPLSLIVLLFGAIEGTKITVFLIFLISTLSVFYLTRYILRYNLWGSLFSSLVFAFSSWGGCVYLDSNYEKLYAYFLPPALVFFIKSIENKKFIFFACLFLGMIVLCGGAIFLPVALFLFLFACAHSIGIGRRAKISFDPRYLKNFFLIVFITLLLCMAKIIPMHSLFSRQDIGSVHFSYEHNYPLVSRHIIEEERALNPRKLYEMLFVKDAYIVGTHGVTGDDHMQFYLGYMPVLLAIASFALQWRKSVRYLLLLAVFILLSFGPYGRPDLFKWFWYSHPVAHSIWRPDEFFTFPIFFTLAVVAGGLFSLFEKGKRRIALLFLILAAALSLNSMFWPNRRFLHNQTLKEVPKKMVSAIGSREQGLRFQKEFFHVKIKDPSADPEHYQKDGYFYLQQNIGAANWLYINLEIKSAVIPKYFIERGDYLNVVGAPEKLEINPRYKGEAFFLDESNSARVEHFSPNQIRVAVTLKGADTLVINQNYHKGWRSDTGRVFERDGLLVLALDKPGIYSVRLTYVPLDFYFGLGISALTLVLSYFFLIYKRRGN